MFEIIRRRKKLLLLAAGALVAAIALKPVWGMLAQLCAGGAALAFVMLPLVKLLSRRLKRTAAIFAAFRLVALALLGTLVMIVPLLAGQAQALMRSLPELGMNVRSVTDRITGVIAAYTADNAGARASLARQLASKLDELPAQIVNVLGGLLSGTANMAGSIADGMGRFSLMVMLSYYFLKDRERILMQLELMLPEKLRTRAVAACGSIQHELSGYVRGQLVISLIVGLITAAGLAALRVPAFLVLGVITAVFNLIPYFGSLLGALPTVLLTLSMGWLKVLEVIVMLFVAQQIENMVIAPHVTGRTTGLHPVAVILSLTACGYMGGVMGMVFAIPGAIVLRGAVRELMKSPAKAPII